MKGIPALSLMLWAVLLGVACESCSAQSAFTLFDDGDRVYNDGIYDLGGRGRPGSASTSSGEPYSGREYLTIWGDTSRGSCRQQDRISAFVRSDVGLDSSKDWWISIAVGNDVLSPDMGFRLWLLDFKPDSTFLNSGNLESRATFSLAIGDRLPNNSSRGGLSIEAVKTTGRVDISPFRLDPNPTGTGLRKNRTRITIEWFADSGLYRWTVCCNNGAFQVTQPASEIALRPAVTFIAAGTTDNVYWMGSAWTIWDLAYGQGPLPTKLSVDARHRLFLDNRVRATVDGMRLVQGTLRKHPGNPVVRCELPWERNVLHFSTVLQEPDTGLFRMWYGADAKYMLYATSVDGVRWKKPLDIGTVPFEGNTRMNIVADRMHVAVSYDPEGPEAARYKAAYAVSPDGFHWTPLTQELETRLVNVQGICFDESIRRYVACCQYTPDFKTTGRSVARQESKDFVEWTPRKEILKPNERDPAGTELYGMTSCRESDGYVGFLWLFHTDLAEKPMPRQRGPIDIELVWSPDGFIWMRPFQGQVFLPRGTEGSWEDGMVFSEGPPVRVGDELWFYYSGREIEHGEQNDKGSLGLATLRLDGYAYLEPESESGSVTTPPLELRGRRLLINAAAGGGEVRVEVLRATGGPLPGYSAADCVPIKQDGVRCEVAWSGSKLLPLSPEPLRLKFIAKRAKLYSFWVER